MAAVAGYFSQLAGEYLNRLPGCSEIIVENGGDIFIASTQELNTVFTPQGKSHLPVKIAVRWQQSCSLAEYVPVQVLLAAVLVMVWLMLR